MTIGKDYFAGQEASEVAREIEGKISDFSSHIQSTGIQQRWAKAYQLYYGKHFKGGSFGSIDADIQRLGENGELAGVSVNHFRNLIKHTLALTVNQKPSFDARAVNSDLKSLQQAKLANNILDAYLREKRLGRYLKYAAEQAQIFGKGFVYITWEPSLGKPYAVEDYVDSEGQPAQRVKNEGDIDVCNPSPFDVYCDAGAEDWNRIQWVCVRQFKNKFDLSVRYSELSNDILNIPTKSDLEGRNYLTLQALNDSADVPVYAFYHKRTDALPNGRYILFCNADTILYDGPIPYKKLPVFRITPGEIFGSTEGYSDAFDLMNIQDAYNVLISTVFSNQQAFGVQNILIPEGCNLTAEQIGQSLAALKYNPQAGEPKALQLTSTPPEVFKSLEIFEKLLETISGINSVARGNPDSSLKSGVALGLVQSMATAFASSFQQSWAELLEDSGTFILELLKTFAQTPRMVSLAGKHNRGYMAEFTGSDLENIDRVVVELGNPMARTTAGRVEIANTLLQQGLVKTPQEYLTVMNTGNLDPLTEGPEAELALMRKENEEMMDARPVQAMVGDSHVLHMQEHKALLSNPLIRRDSNLVGLVLGHIQEHMQLYKTQDPLWSMVAGEPPAPQPQGPMGPPPPDAGPGGPPTPVGNGVDPGIMGSPMDQPPPPPPMPKTANQGAGPGGVGMSNVQ